MERRTAYNYDTNVPLACGWDACKNERPDTGMPNRSGKRMGCGDAMTRTHGPNGSFIVRHTAPVFLIAKGAVCGMASRRGSYEIAESMAHDSSLRGLAADALSASEVVADSFHPHLLRVSCCARVGAYRLRTWRECRPNDAPYCA